MQDMSKLKLQKLYYMLPYDLLSFSFQSHRDDTEREPAWRIKATFRLPSRCPYDCHIKKASIPSPPIYIVSLF